MSEPTPPTAPDVRPTEWPTDGVGRPLPKQQASDTAYPSSWLNSARKEDEQ